MNTKAQHWLSAHGIVLKESFARSLTALAMAYQKQHGIRRLDDVYRLIGARKQLIHYWQHNPSTQTKQQFKQTVIHSSVKLFQLSKAQAEQLANSAGFSLAKSSDFCTHFQAMLAQSAFSQREICEKAQVSERMLYLAKSGRKCTKATLLALAVALDMDIKNIDRLLQRAGYVLSQSIASDMVIRWLIERHAKLIDINYLLDELGLPLLMTREKSPN